VTVENVGGIDSMKRELKKGLNIIELPNSAGKTSFCRGLELLALEDDELRNKPHYLNLYAGYNGKGRVFFQDEQRRVERTFTRGARGLAASGDYLAEGDAAWLVSFATIDNRIIVKALAGEGLKPEFESLSNSKAFDVAKRFYEDRSADAKHRYDLFYSEKERELPATLKESERLQTRLGELQDQLKKLPTVPKEVEATERENVSIAQAAQNEVTEKNRVFVEAQRESRANEEQTKESVKERERLRRRIADEWNEVVAEMDDMPTAFKKALTEEDLYRKLEQLRDVKDAEPSLLDGYAKDLLRALGDIEFSKKGSDVRPEEGSLAYWEGQMALITNALNLIEKSARYVKETEKCPVCQRSMDEHDLSTARGSLGKEQRRIDNEIAALEKDLRLLQSIRDRITSRHEAFEEVEGSLGRLNDSITRLERKRKELEASVKKAEEQLEKAEENFNKAKEAIDKTIAKILTDRRDLSVKVDEIASLLEQANQRVKALQGELKGAAELKVEIQEAQNLADMLEQRKEGRLREWITDYEKLVNDLFDKLGFEGFEIKINPEDYTVSITRQHPRTKTPITWNLNALSRSEAVTVAVAMLLAAKKQYAPGFPFFVMDEVIYSYDPTRLERLKNHAQDVTDYVVMTQLARPAR
jgi:conjugal transfer/entry exclusion protein